MKNLKLLFLPLLLVGFLNVSCNNDDDSSDNNVDVIVGKWKVTDVFMGGVSVYDQVSEVAYCPLQNEYNFMNDYSLRIDTFVEGIVPEACLPGEPETGSWSENNDVYTVTFDNSGESSSSTINLQGNNKFTTETTFEGQNVVLEFTRQ